MVWVHLPFVLNEIRQSITKCINVMKFNAKLKRIADVKNVDDITTTFVYSAYRGNARWFRCICALKSFFWWNINFLDKLKLIKGLLHLVSFHEHTCIYFLMYNNYSLQWERVKSRFERSLAGEWRRKSLRHLTYFVQARCLCIQARITWVHSSLKYQDEIYSDNYILQMVSIKFYWCKF